MGPWAERLVLEPDKVARGMWGDGQRYRHW